RGVFPVVIAKEDTFVSDTQSGSRPFEWKLIRDTSAFDYASPVVVFTLYDVAKLVFGATNRGEIESFNRCTDDVVIAQVNQVFRCVRHPKTAPVCVPGDRPRYIRGGDLRGFHPVVQHGNSSRYIRWPMNQCFYWRHPRCAKNHRQRAKKIEEGEES